MNVQRSARIACAVVMAISCSVGYGVAGNSIQNPNFDTDISAWTDANNTSFWVDDDYQGAAHSGAVLVGVPALFESHLTQCVDSVSANTTYVVSAAASSTCGNDAELNLYWTDEECGNLTFGASQTISVANQWATLRVVAKAPNQRGAAVVMLRNNGGCHGNVDFDGASFFPNEIFFDGFSTGAVSQ